MSEIDKFLNGGKDSVQKKPRSEVDDFLSDAPAQDKGLGGHLKDAGLSLAQGVISVPESIVGLADIPTGGRVGKFLENEDGLLGFRPKQAREYLDEFKTDKTKEQQQEFADADGILAKTGVALSNPSMIANTLVESAPTIGLGGVFGRGALAGAKVLNAGANTAKASVAAGAVGEGLAMAGSQASQIRGETEDGLLTPEQSLYSLATGGLGAVFGYGGGLLAKRLGIGDVDTLFTQGAKRNDIAGDIAQEIAKQPAKSIPRNVIEGAITEGFLEELPQSVSEQILQNLALDKDWAEGVDEAIVMGTLAGMAMGAGAGGYSGLTKPSADTGAQGAQGYNPNQPPDGMPPTDLPSNDIPPGTDPSAYKPEAEPFQSAGQSATSSPLDLPVPVSEQMGIDPNTGPMSTAAALAVDSGATEALAVQAAQQQAAAQAGTLEAAAAKAQPAPEGVDPATGEIVAPAAKNMASIERSSQQQAPEDRAGQLEERIGFIQQQAKNTGWDKSMLAARDEAQAELDSIKPQAQTQAQLEPVSKQAAAPTANDIKAITAKQIPQMTDAELQQAANHYGPDHKRTAKLNREIAKRGITTPVETNTNGIETTQTEQASTQRTQAPAATGTQPASPVAVESAPTVITQQDGAPFKSKIAAGREMNKRGLSTTHEVVKDGAGYIVRDKQQPEAQSVATPTYEQAKADVDTALDRVREASKVMDKFPTGNMGLTPDAVKATPEWQAAYAESNAALKQLQDANKVMVKNYAKESREDRNAARQAKLDASKISETDGYEDRKAGRIKRINSAKSVEEVDNALNEENSDNERHFEGTSEVTQKAQQKRAQLGFDEASAKREAARREFELSINTAVETGENVDSLIGELESRLKKLEAETYHLADSFAQGKRNYENDPERKQIEADLERLQSAAKAELKMPEVDSPEPNILKAAKDLGKLEVIAVGDSVKEKARPVKEKAEKEAIAEKDAERFAGNKLFTSDAVAKARERMKSKLGQLNSGIDPELLVDGMTIAGAYIESGVRKFSDYAKAMIEDLGDGVKPYLLSFWEGARNYPGLDTEGMSSQNVSRIQFEAMLSKEQATEIAPEAVGVVADKPAKRTRKTGAKGDMVLTQDWGVPHIDGYGDSNDRETGNDTKDAFLKEARGYLNAVSDALRSHGFEPHLDRRGKAEKPVSVSEGGPAGSGDVTLIMQNPDNGNKAYITIGDTSLRGVVPSTESGIAIMYRVGAGEDRYASKHGNTWAPVDLSANELALLINNSAMPKQGEVTNEQPTNEDADQGRAPEVRGRGSDPQQGASPADRGDVGARQPTDGRAPEEAGATGRSGVREPRADVAGDGSESKGGNVGDGRTGTGRAGSPDAGTRSAAERNKQPDLESPAAASVQAKDLHIDNPLEIVGGTPVQRFNRNRAALELLQTLEVEGRQANPEEQKTLAAYIGWGSFGQELFQGSWDKPVYRDEGVWKSRGEWLRDTLGESAWKSAQRSITNAHYTDPPTVMAMWDMVKRMGFTGGKVQEPSMGTGNFFSMMPADLKSRSQLTGIELDETTGAIAKQLFPRSNVRVMGYQESQTPDGFYDLIIGNWPFENTPVADRRYNKLDPMLHDYFFLKTLDQVRAGGIVIGITSAGSMDKQSTMIRRELARKSELIASIRLPSGAFADYAGTKVVTDIVILRKRPERLVAIPKDVNWIETGEVKTPSGEMVRINQYYIDNPQNIIGTLDFGSGTTTFRAGMIVHRPENMAERLQQAIELVPADAFQQSTQVDHLTYYANESNERHGALALVGDKLMVAMGDQLVLANDKAKYEVKDQKQTADREAQLKGVAALGKLHTALVNAERKGDDAEPARKALNKAFKEFTNAHGPIRESFGLKYLQRIDDPYYAEIAALEGDDGKPAAVLERSTTRSRKEIKNPSVRDAYVLARNQSINPSIEEVAALAGKSPESVKQELMESGAVFEAPNGDIVPSDIYLSGNVRQKMREAQAGLAEGNKAMEKNVKALEEVMPADVPYFNIETKLGATWVSPQAYAQYVANMLSSESADGIEVAFRSGRWSVKLDKGLNQKPEASANYGTVHASFSRLVQAAMSNQTLRLTSKDADGNESYDPAKTEEVNARIAKIRDDFGTWLWSDPERRVDMELEYNEARNAWSTPKYDGSFLTFEGMALTLGKGQFNLREHQVNAIWRAIVNRRSLNAHEVGTGKTFTMGGIAVESRRYGIAKKPVLLAHNANSATVAAEIRQMYPQARVLYVDNLDAKNRAIRLRQIANDDWDVIVMPHSLIDRLSLREETLMEMAADDIAALESEFLAAAEEDGIDGSKVDLDDDEAVAKVRSVTAKELAKARKRIIENIKKQSQQASKEGAVSFEELGIDMVLVDEVHEFKKPPIVTRMQMKGLNTQVSGRSIALQFLTRYVRQMNNGGNVHTFTGTPITNTITEIYHQMRYVMENEMDDANVADWDGWFGSFATEVQDVELSAAGDYEMVTRLAGFVNVPELRQMVGQYMDTVFADDMPEMQPRKTKSGKQLTDETINEAERAELLNGRTEDAKDRPYKKVINASADMTVRQQEVFSQLQGYAQDWRNASGKERRELMRTGDPRSPIVTEGIATKASFDVRLLDESLAGMEGKTNDDPNSKASRVVNNVLEIYKSNPLAGQVVFAEIGFSKSVRRTRTGPDGEKTTTTVKVFSTIHDVIERLVQGGIPRDQIALVDGSVKKERRREIAEQMNSGKLRVVLGSTDTLGVGVNMQKNLRAMHHMDAPYMPGELEQRNGRGQRQGNQWNTVLEYRYMTDRLDGRRWQILAVKQRFITAFMKASNNARVIEGEAAADEQSDILESFSEAAGDPRILQRVKLQKKEESLKRKERMYTQGISGMRRQARNSAERATQLTGRLEKLKQAGTEENIQKLITSQREAFKATIDGKSYDTRVDAVKALESFAASSMRLGDGIKQIGTYAGHPVTMEWPGFHDEPTTTIKAFGEVFSGKGIAGAEARMRNYFKTVEADVKERDAALATSENMQKAMQQPFAQSDELERVSNQLKDLEKDLEVNPVPPPAWLRQGAPMDSEVYWNKTPYVVSGHRYTATGWFVVADDDKGSVLIPYMEAKDSAGMEVYEERDFISPEVQEQKPSESEAPKFSFAGKTARSADVAALDNAKVRIASVDNAEAVRQETGWSRGDDGKWRFEISDDQAKLRVAGKTAGEVIDSAALDAINGNRKFPVTSDLIDHAQLFVAYPKLSNIKVEKMPAGGTALARLQRRATGFTIQLRESMPRDKVASAILHELQHGIQVYEGFAVGGSKNMVFSDLDMSGAKAYRALAGEVEARNTQTRHSMTPALRRNIAPELTQDTPSADVIVTFNGKDITNKAAPNNVNNAPITDASLVRAFDVQFPRLTKAVRTMLARGNKGERGGVVVLDSADPLMIARAFASKTGKPLSQSVQMFSDAGVINGFFDPKSGLTFLVGPNLNPVTGTAVLLHEMIHGQQRQKIDKAALSMLMNRGKEKNAETRAFLDRVAARMDDAGETENAQEAGAYIVEQAVMEGKSAGYGTADSRFLSWVDQNIGKKVGDFLRLFIGNVRSWALRNGLPIGPITVDDLVSYAMAGMEQASRGNIQTSSGLMFGRAYHGTPHSFDRFSLENVGTGEGAQAYGWGLYFAENRGVAEHYRDILGYVSVSPKSESAKKRLDDALNYADGAVAEVEMLVQQMNYNDSQIAKALTDQADRLESQANSGNPYYINAYRVIADLINSGELETKKSANLYQVDVPEKTDLLNWDGQITESQRSIVSKSMPHADTAKTGKDLYRMLSRELGGDKNASMHLDSLGIKGIYYLDGASRKDKEGNHNYVIWDENTVTIEAVNDQKKEAELFFSRGGFDQDNPGIRFSRSGFKGIASKATYELNKTFNAPGKLSKWHTTVGTMNNLAQRSPHFKPVFEAAQGFIDDVAYYAADAAELAGKLLPKLETWKDIAKKPISAPDNAAIEKPINEGTLVWTRDASGKPVRVENLATSSANMSTEEKARELMDRGMLDAGMNSAWKGQGEDKYAKLIDSRYESKMLKAGIVWTPAELKSMFGLTDDQVGLYQEFRAAVDRSLDTMGRADMLRFGGEDLKPLRQIVMDEPDIQSAARLLVAQLSEMSLKNPDRETQLMQTAHGIMERAAKVAELQADGYAPLSRFGKYTIDVVENGERQYFGLFETAREANAMAEKMRAEFGADSVTQGTLSDESYKLFAGITPESLELFGNMLGLDSDGDTAQDQAFQEYLRLTKTNRSAMRRLIHRKGIAGFSSDVGRVLASFVYSNARQTSAGLNMGDLGDAISKIPKQQGELTDVAVRLSEYIKNPQEEAQAVRGLLFAQYLGGSVASAFVNITQPFAVTFPWLSQHGGARKAAAEIARAAKDMSTKGKKYEADLSAALKAAEDDGTVSPQEVHQLMAQARGSGSLGAGDGTRLGDARAAAKNSVARLSLAWGKLFGAAEQVNRRVTFIAAFRVARDQGIKNPAEFAREAVRETQFIYSKANKMQWGRGAVGGTLMTFKTYSVAYIELMHRLWNQGEKGSLERKEGRKAAMLMIATLMLMGGAGGLPFAEDAEDLIDGAAQLMGYNFSAKKAKEQFLIDVFGESLAEFVDKGVSGLPGSPMDVSGRLGLGNLIPGTGLFTERTSHSRDLLEIAGPAGDLASRALSGTKKILGGDIGAGVTDFMPTAVRNAMKGVDMAATGMYRDTKGYKVLDTNMLEAALKGVGFQPKGVSKVQEANWLNQREKNFYSMKAQEIRAQWAAGIFEKDAGKVQAARDAVNEWNRKNPDQRIVIRIPDVMRRVREMAKSKDQRIADTAPKAMRARMREESARMREELN